MNGQPRFTILGKLISFVLVLGLVGLGSTIRGRSGSTPGGPAETADARARLKCRRSRSKSQVVASGRLSVQGQHRPDRDQRIRGLCRTDCSQRRAGADRKLVVLQEPRIQGPVDDQRGRVVVGIQRRQDGRLGDDGRRARRLRQAAACRGAGADWVLARRRRDRGPERHQADQPAEGQDDRDGAVHRG